MSAYVEPAPVWLVSLVFVVSVWRSLPDALAVLVLVLGVEVAVSLPPASTSATEGSLAASSLAPDVELSWKAGLLSRTQLVR
jgi:hypothetical protein